MKRSIRSLTALLMTVVLLLCLYPMMPALAESAADSSAQSTEEPEKKEKVSAETLQAQGILSVGAKGEDVTRLQQRLKDLGYLDGKVDGQYGGGTKRAVIAFQRMHGLTTDGVAGQETQEKLYAEDAKHAPDGSPVNVLEGDVPMLVNKDNPVPSGEFFVPADMVQLNKELSSKLVTIKYKKTRGVKAAVDALKEMLEAAKEDGIGKWQISAGYRTWDDQVSMLNSKVKSIQKSHKDWSSSKARRAALRTVAEPGSSVMYRAIDNNDEIQLLGKDVNDIKNLGISLAFVPEDRLGMGLVGNMGMVGNMLLRSYNEGRGIFTREKEPRELAEEIKDRLEVSTPNIYTPVRKLSGGNVQKVLVGREISLAPRVLMTAYAVRGLDINTSYTIYNILSEEKQKGVGVVYVGEDLDVLVELCDRILVLCEGKVSGIVDARTTTKEELGVMMTKYSGDHIAKINVAKLLENDEDEEAENEREA